jgi:hypothetical protein
VLPQAGQLWVQKIELVESCSASARSSSGEMICVFCARTISVCRQKASDLSPILVRLRRGSTKSSIRPPSFSCGVVLAAAIAARGPAGVLCSAAKRRVVPRQQVARSVGWRLTNSPGTPAAEQMATGKGASSLRGIVKGQGQAPHERRSRRVARAIATPAPRHRPMNRAIPIWPTAAANEDAKCHLLAPTTPN